MTNLGVLLKLTFHDAEAALFWWTKAAEAGNAQAMMNLGRFYSGRKQDREARRWYNRANEAGFHVGVEEYLGKLNLETTHFWKD